MAQLDSAFNANDAELSEGFDGEPLPVGEYVLELTASTRKDTASGNGWGISCEFTVLSDTMAGRKVFEYLNLGNTIDETRRRANATLAKLCLAVGVASVSDTVELHSKPFLAHVKVTPARGDYGPGNKITSFKSLAGVVGRVPMKTAPAPKAAVTAPGWTKKSA